MSLPLTRRIAKTVLLTAAGAASVVGTAGVASAAELPTTADVGGLSKLDNGVAGDVEGTASQGAKALTPMSSTSPLHSSSVPEAGLSASTNNGKAGPAAMKLTGSDADASRGGQPGQAPNAQKAVPPVATQGLPTDSLTQGTPLQDSFGEDGTATAATGTGKSAPKGNPAQGTAAKGTPAQGTAAQGNPAQGAMTPTSATGLDSAAKTLLPNGLGTVST